MNPVLLCGSLPDKKREPRYYKTADMIAIRECVRALATVVLPRALLVFGGHPAITPLISLVAQRLGKTENLCMFQSAYFDEPQEAMGVGRVVITPQVKHDLGASLKKMRREMVRSQRFAAAVFVGGMEGVEDEYVMFCRANPKVPVYPMASTGAAAGFLFDRLSPKRRKQLEPLVSSRIYGAVFDRVFNTARGS